MTRTRSYIAVFLVFGGTLARANWPPSADLVFLLCPSAGPVTTAPLCQCHFYGSTRLFVSLCFSMDNSPRPFDNYFEDEDDEEDELDEENEDEKTQPST